MSNYIEELAKLANMSVGDFTLEGWYKKPIADTKYKLASVARSNGSYTFYVDGRQVPYQEYAAVFDTVAYEAFSHLARVPRPDPIKIEIQELRLTKAIREIYSEGSSCSENSSHLKVLTGAEKPPLFITSQNN